MSNLGWYQWITTASKKVGGPLNLLAIFGGSCLAVGGTVGSVITNKYRDIKDKKELKTLGTYSVKKDAEIKKTKLVLKTGDQIAILAADDDSILIVKNGDKDNPYFVSADFLMGCSDYRESEHIALTLTQCYT